MEKWYGQVVAGSKITFDEICTQVSHHCMVTHADVSGVLKEVLKQMARELSAGKSAQLSRLGCFRLSAGSTGVEQAKDFKLSLMKKPKVIFSPGKKLRTILRDATFVRNKVKVITIPGECTESHI